MFKKTTAGILASFSLGWSSGRDGYKKPISLVSDTCNIIQPKTELQSSVIQVLWLV